MINKKVRDNSLEGDWRYVQVQTRQSFIVGTILLLSEPERNKAGIPTSFFEEPLYCIFPCVRVQLVRVREISNGSSKVGLKTF